MKTRKLKIAILHLAFGYSGGGERLVLEEARGLKKLGHDVDIYSPVVDQERCFPDIIKSFHIKKILPCLPSGFPEWESFQVILVCLLAPFLVWKFKRYDIILAANQPSPWIAYWVKLFYKIPYVSYLAQPTRFLYPRSIDLKDGLIFISSRKLSLASWFLKISKPLTYRLDKISIKSSDVILTNGEYIKGLIESIYNVKALSCPAGANPAGSIVKYSKRYKGEVKVGSKVFKKPYILLTNRHFPQKRFEYAITSMPSVLQINPEMTLLISGNPTDYTRKLKDLAKSLSLSRKVYFLGLVKEVEIKSLYANSVLYVYTAPEEDFGMGIIEAMAAGTPVVAWQSGGPAKIIEDGKTGLLAKHLDLIDFDNKICQIVSNQKLAEKLALSGLQLVKNMYSYDIHCKILESVFYQTIK